MTRKQLQQGFEARVRAHDELKNRINNRATIILMRAGRTYETYRDEAVALHDICKRPLSKCNIINNMSENIIDVAWFDAADMETNLIKLIRSGHRVSIVDEPKQTTK